MRAPGSHATAISQISVKFCQFKGSTQNSVGKLVSVLVISRGRQTLFYRWVEVPNTKVFTEEITSKQVKCMKLPMQWYLTDYSEASHTYIVTSSINVQLKYHEFDYWLVNQQPQINDFVLRLFDSSKYLKTLRSKLQYQF